MPLISTIGAASSWGLRSASVSQARGGGGGANGDNSTWPGDRTPLTQTAYFYNSGATYTATVTGEHIIKCIGAGGGGSAYASGGAGGYVEAVVNLTLGEVCAVSVSAGGAYGASGGVGGAKTSFTCLEGVVAAGGGGGGGGTAAVFGVQGTNAAAATNGTTGDASNGGAGGNSFITDALTYQDERGSASRSPDWADGTVVDTGYFAATGGAIGAHGGEGKIYIWYQA